MVTNPAGAFAGNVECPTVIETLIAPGDSGMLVFGVAAVEGIGATQASMEFTDAISVSGLAGGNGSVSRPFSVTAPQLVIVIIDNDVMDGTTKFTSTGALYTVDSIVTASNIMSMSATRSGVVPLAAVCSGFAKSQGFIFSHGSYVIKP